MEVSAIVWNVLALMNVVAFVTFVCDKLLAKAHWQRVSEATLLTLAACGGALGALLGMLLVRHKTRKPKFAIGVPVLLTLQAVILAVVWVAVRP